MTRLSVNINKIATLRNSRGGNIPDVIKAAINCEKFGGQGITVHPRPDERHIRKTDVFELSKIVSTEFNIEGYPSREFIDLVIKVKPAQVTLVPDPPEAITSNQGWDTIKNKVFLTEVIHEFQRNNIRTSVFIGTDAKLIEVAKQIGTNRVELYTEPYASTFPADREAAVMPFRKASEVAKQVGVEINAGHDLNLENLKFFKQNVVDLKEVSIGHALIADALYLGLETTIKKYREQLL